MVFRFNQSVNRFRARRGQLLQRQIVETSDALGRPLNILDIGGRADYWQNVGLRGVGHIVLLNRSEDEFEGTGDASSFPDGIFEERIGDARDLREYENAAFDLVHSNSVIEHVGGWADMAAMAREARRVAHSGWIQTPAAEFPIEPHFHLPFIHWLGKPVRASALRLSPIAAYRQCSDADRRGVVDSIHLLSKREVARLFPSCEIFTEMFFLPKSYVVRWRHPT